MTITELETHRRTITTPHGPVSCIDVGSGPVTLFVHGLGTNEVIEIGGGRLFFPEERPSDLIDALRKHWAR
jgi:hypothetical protein